MFSHNKIWLSLLLVLLVVIVSCIGYFTPGFYARETINWQTQSAGQDLIDLALISPVLLISVLLMRKGNRIALYISAGATLYLAYTFLIYCVAVKFNQLFVFYCLVLGLSFYSFLDFLLFALKIKIRSVTDTPESNKIAAIYFISIAILFYGLWLSEIEPSVWNNTVPESLDEVGLATNPVHVLDLAFLLPAVFITGLMLLKRNVFGILLTPALLTFFILMDITIGVLTVMMYVKDLTDFIAVAFIMAALAFFSIVLLILFIKRNKMTLREY